MQANAEKNAEAIPFQMLHLFVRREKNVALLDLKVASVRPHVDHTTRLVSFATKVYMMKVYSAIVIFQEFLSLKLYLSI